MIHIEMQEMDKKLEGKASKALQDCLEGKRKAEQKGK